MSFVAPGPRAARLAALAIAACAACADAPRPRPEAATSVRFVRPPARASRPGAAPRLSAELEEDPDASISVVAPFDALAPTPAPAAQPPGAVAAARALFAQGVEAAAGGDWPRAADAFAAAYRAAPRWPTLFNLAQAYRNAGHPGPALAAIAALRREAARVPSGTTTRDDATDRLEVALWASAATLRVAAAPVLRDARASVDGVPAAQGPVIALDPGRHVVRIEQPGAPALERAFVARPGARYLLRVEPLRE